MLRISGFRVSRAEVIVGHRLSVGDLGKINAGGAGVSPEPGAERLTAPARETGTGVFHYRDTAKDGQTE